MEAGADTLIGSSANNVIDGGLGNDITFGFVEQQTPLNRWCRKRYDTCLLGGDAIYGGTYDGVTPLNSGLDC